MRTLQRNIGADETGNGSEAGRGKKENQSFPEVQSENEGIYCGDIGGLCGIWRFGI